MQTVLFFLSIGVILYSYLLYPILLALIPVKRRPAPSDPAEWPSVSLVLSVYNEEKHIAAKLQNLLSLDYPAAKLEILIGSDGSSDRTDEIVRTFDDPRIKLMSFSQRSGKPGVLNRLTPLAAGELMVFTDANALFAPDSLKKLARHFSDPGVGGVCGKLVFHGATGETSEGAYWKLETFLKTRESDLDSCLGANGAIYAIRSAAWPEIPDNTLVDDFVVAMKVREQGLSIRYDTEATAYEDLPPRIGDEVTRRIRIGAGDFQALTLCWRSLLPWRGFYTFAFWSHKVLRWGAPFFMIAALGSNLLLSREPFFALTLSMQLAFYAMALLGGLVRGARLRWLRAPRYFVTINMALLLGFFRFITGTQQVAWKRTAR